MTVLIHNRRETPASTSGVAVLVLRNDDDDTGETENDERKGVVIIENESTPTFLPRVVVATKAINNNSSHAELKRRTAGNCIILKTGDD